MTQNPNQPLANDGYRHRKVLVTGGRGFIGQHLCSRLTEAGASVYTVGRTASTPKGNGPQHVQADLTQADAVDALIKSVRPDLIFHLASHVLGARGIEVVRSTFANNLLSTVNLLNAAQEAGVSRILLTGSMEEPDPTGEWSVPSSPYAAAKLAAGQYGRMFHALYGMDIVNLRVYMVYGPGQADLKKLIPYVITSLAQGQSPKLGSGSRLVDWIFVKDVVDACIAAGLSDDLAGKTVEIGSGELHSVADVVRRIHELMGATQPPTLGGAPDRPMEQERKADLDRTRASIPWSPSTSLEAGLSQTIAWYTNAEVSKAC